MSGYFFPPLDAQTLQSLDIVKELIETHKDYFDDCPYPSSTEKLLRKLFVPKPAQFDTVFEPPKRGPGRPPKGGYLDDSNEVNPPPEEPVELPEFDGLEKELTELYRHMKSAKNAKGQDAVDYAKQAMNMLEKITKLRASIENIQMVVQFRSTVLTILDEICTEPQRAQFMIRLKEYLNPDMKGVAEVLSEETKVDP